MPLVALLSTESNSLDPETSIAIAFNDFFSLDNLLWDIMSNRLAIGGVPSLRRPSREFARANIHGALLHNSKNYGPEGSDEDDDDEKYYRVDTAFLR